VKLNLVLLPFLLRVFSLPSVQPAGAPGGSLSEEEERSMGLLSSLFFGILFFSLTCPACSWRKLRIKILDEMSAPPSSPLSGFFFFLSMPEAGIEERELGSMLVGPPLLWFFLLSSSFPVDRVAEGGEDAPFFLLQDLFFPSAGETVGGSKGDGAGPSCWPRFFPPFLFSLCWILLLSR